MGLTIFRREFVVRHFGEEEIIDGYGTAPYSDTVEVLNVQPLSADELQALPEGERKTKRMKAFSDFVFNTADQSTGRRGDWLFYRGNMDPVGHWYECVSSLGWDHTMLSHCRSEFVQVAEAESYTPEPPKKKLKGRGGIKKHERRRS